MILCFALLIACSHEDSKPKNVLPQEKIVPVLLDIYMAEGKVNDLRISHDSSVAIFDVYEDKIFEKHQIVDSVYRASMSYYFANPDQLEGIYETVLDSLNLREQRLKESKDDIEKEKDKEDKKK